MKHVSKLQSVPAAWVQEIEKTLVRFEESRAGHDESTDTRGSMCAACDKPLHLLSLRQQCRGCKRRFCGSHQLCKGMANGLNHQTLCHACFGDQYGLRDMQEDGAGCRMLMSSSSDEEEEVPLTPRVNGRRVEPPRRTQEQRTQEQRGEDQTTGPQAAAVRLRKAARSVMDAATPQMQRFTDAVLRTTSRVGSRGREAFN